MVKRYASRRQSWAFDDATVRAFWLDAHTKVFTRRFPNSAAALIALLARLKLGHVIGVGGEYEGSETFGYHGEVGIDDVRCIRCCESAAHRYRLIECVDIEMTQGASQVCLSGGLSPYLGEDGMGCVEIGVPLGTSLDERP